MFWGPLSPCSTRSLCRDWSCSAPSSCSGWLRWKAFHLTNPHMKFITSECEESPSCLCVYSNTLKYQRWRGAPYQMQQQGVSVYRSGVGILDNEERQDADSAIGNTWLHLHHTELQIVSVFSSVSLCAVWKMIDMTIKMLLIPQNDWFLWFILSTYCILLQQMIAKVKPNLLVDVIKEYKKILMIL